MKARIRYALCLAFGHRGICNIPWQRDAVVECVGCGLKAFG
jgi:hypothetical protein